MGALLTGVFAAPSLGGQGVYDYVANKISADYSIGGQVITQATAVGTTILWSAVVAFIAYKIVDLTVGCASPRKRSAKDSTSARTASRPIGSRPRRQGYAADRSPSRSVA
jgi:Amt family ammonium transporter